MSQTPASPASTAALPRLLVVDDEMEIADLVATVAEMAGFAPTILTDSREFEKIYNQGEFHTIVLDLVMPELDGIEILRQLAAQRSRAQIILMSGFDGATLYTANQLASAHGLDIVCSISKPFRIGEMKTVLDKIQQQAASLSEKNTIPSRLVSPTELNYAMKRGDFCFYYQPQICLGDQKIIGFEALMRWKQPDGNMVAPANFIPVAEQSGQIGELTWSTLEHSLLDFKTLDWIAPGCTLSINLSPDQLSDLSLPDNLTRLIRQFYIDPQRIIIEITETGILRDLTVALDILTRLRLKGFGMSIDDFGTGSATLQQLRQLPITELKIDQSFVADLWSGQKDRIIVESTIALAQKLGLRTVAEGIEHLETAELLKNLGVNIGQGYALGKPMSIDNISLLTA